MDIYIYMDTYIYMDIYMYIYICTYIYICIKSSYSWIYIWVSATGKLSILRLEINDN